MIPNRTKTTLLHADINLAQDTVRIALLKATTEYTPNPDTHEFVDDILDGQTGEELTASNYTRKTVTGTSVEQNDTDNTGEWQADDVRYRNLGGSETVEAILIYKQVGGDDATPGDDPVLRVIDDDDVSALEADTDGQDLEIIWADTGILTAH